MYLETAVVKLQEGLAISQTGVRPWHQTWGIGFAGMQNARVVGVRKASIPILEEDLGGQTMCL